MAPPMAPTPEKNDASEKVVILPTRMLLPLLFAVFLDLVGFGAIIPDVQTRLESWGASGWQIGLVLSSYSFVQLAVSPFWGRYSDRVGRKPVLLICGTLSALSLVAYAVANSLWFVLVSRIFAGFAAANVVAAQGYVADMTAYNAARLGFHPDDNRIDDARATMMGKVGAAVTAGLTLGPALGGWLADVGGNALLGWGAAAASGLGALWIALAVPSVPPQVAKPETAPVTAQKRKRNLWHDLPPAIRPMLILSFSSMLALACLEGTFGRLIKATLGLGPREFGFIFAYESVLGVISQSLLMGPITRRVHSPRRLLWITYLMQAIGLAMTPFAPGLFFLFLASTLYAIGTGIASPTLAGLTSRAAADERQGEAFGLMQTARATGFLAGPTVGGVLFDTYHAAPYLLAGVVLTVSAFLALRMTIPPPIEPGTGEATPLPPASPEPVPAVYDRKAQILTDRSAREE